MILLLESVDRSRLPGMMLHHIGAAQEIVRAVDSPSVKLIFDTAHIQAMDGKVVAKGRCFVRSEKVGERYTHDQLLDNQAAALKGLIVRKSQECAAKMEAAMKIAPPPAAAPAPTS